MRWYVTLSNVFYLLRIKMCIYYSLIRRLASRKVCMFVFYCVVTVCNVGYDCSFCGEIFVDFVSFSSMIIL